MKNKCVVYVSSFPFNTERLDIFPVEREREIARCKSEKSKAEKFYDWKLLEFAINDLFNKNISEVNLKKVGDKWLCDDFCFSLSHSENVVTVAVSNIGVGVDAEKVDDIRFSQLNVDRILTSKEKDKYLLLSDDARAQFLNIAWSKKESIFKKSNQKIFQRCSNSYRNDKL